MLQISWPALAAILALVPLCVGAFSRSLALRFRAELAEFRNLLMEDMNDRYMLRDEAERRFALLFAELKEMRNEFLRLIAEPRRERDRG